MPRRELPPISVDSAPRGRARRWTRALAAAACTVALAWPSQAAAADKPKDDRPWGRGTMVPTLSLGASGLFSDITSLNFGLGFGYYIVAGLSAGLSFSDTVLIYRSSIKAQYPGIEDQLPTNVFDITPTLQYVFFRSRRFSPFVYGGAGPVFFNHGAGTYGQWVAGPGVLLNVSGPLFVSLGVGFSGMFPTSQCKDSLTYQPTEQGGDSLLLDLCSFRWGPQLGMVVSFGGGRASRRERRREREEREERSYEPPPRVDNPMNEVEPEPTVAEPEPVVAEPEPEPIPDAPPPTSDAPPTNDAPTELSPPTEPPSDAPPPSEPPAETPPPSDGSTDAPSDVAPPPSEITLANEALRMRGLGHL